MSRSGSAIPADSIKNAEVGDGKEGWVVRFLVGQRGIHQADVRRLLTEMAGLPWVPIRHSVFAKDKVSDRIVVGIVEIDQPRPGGELSRGVRIEVLGAVGELESK